MDTVIKAEVTEKIHWTAPLYAIDRAITHLENFAIAVLIATMLGLGIVQIAMWNLFHQGLAWADPMLRHLVLWVGMVGGSMATSARRHLNMDALSRLLPPKGKAVAGFLVELASALVAGVLAWVSIIFINQEMASGAHAFLGVARWQAQLIMPIAFGIMAYRFMLASLEDLRKVL